MHKRLVGLDLDTGHMSTEAEARITALAQAAISGLLAQVDQLTARVAALETSGVPQQPALQSDGMYSVGSLQALPDGLYGTGALTVGQDGLYPIGA